MRVLIVDDHKLFAEAIQMVLENGGMETVVAGTAEEALAAARRESPDMVLLDIGLADQSGIAVGKELLERYPEMKVVIVTSLSDERVLQEAIRAGFHGFLTKDTKIPQLVRAIQSAFDGQLVVPQRLLGPKRNGGAYDAAALLASQLTPREGEVIALLAQGASSGDIASALQISPNTVRTHVQSILAKLQVHSRLEAVAFAVRNDMLPTRSSAPYSVSA